MHGPPAEWGQSEHLLAVIADRLGGISWQLGGGKGQRPQAIPRPKASDRLPAGLLEALRAQAQQAEEARARRREPDGR